MKDRPLGASVDGSGRTTFLLWAPRAAAVRIRLEGSSPSVRALRPLGNDYFGLEVDDAPPGTRYTFSLDDGPWRPDPASRRQPEGVHGPSEVVSPTFPWTDRGWPGVPLEALVFYELEIGTFTRAGTFDAAIERLDELRDLGVTAVELMPVAEVPGGPMARNWGYDGVSLFAVRESFGGRAGLHRFVDACHARGLAVIIDVVYNHLGPEGNYLGAYGPYFTRQYTTPWGEALNLDGFGSDEVRRYVMEHALEQLEQHHADGLRLDSVVSLFDRSARPFLEELSEATDALAVRLRRPLHLIGEADDNDPRWVRPRTEGGLGLHAMWADDLHHAVHAFLTGERGGYYADFGRIEQVSKAFFRGSALEGEHATYRGRRWGRPLAGLPPERLVVYAQNHDQVGNRPDGARLSTLLDPPAHRAALSITLLSPYLPLLFMGQEVGSRQPFHFYTSFEDPVLARSVRAGRARDVAPYGDVALLPGPQSVATMETSRPFEPEPDSEEAAAFRALHGAALRLRLELRSGDRPVPLGLVEGAFWGRYPTGHVIVVILTERILTFEPLFEGELRFDSEAWTPGGRPAPATMSPDVVVTFEGPRVLVYGPQRAPENVSK